MARKALSLATRRAQGVAGGSLIHIPVIAPAYWEDGIFGAWTSIIGAVGWSYPLSWVRHDSSQPSDDKVMACIIHSNALMTIMVPLLLPTCDDGIIGMKADALGKKCGSI